ncbi:Uncharacterised protein [Bartonella grahamii]|uniref:Uncharacterized protein n=1 Tax=Bartonella grahamii TaxID=33045 RepID=A0A336NCF0_BARGR|nr:Uncharacterised protein [Bartonella grahamii]
MKDLSIGNLWLSELHEWEAKRNPLDKNLDYWKIGSDRTLRPNREESQVFILMLNF